MALSKISKIRKLNKKTGPKQVTVNISTENISVLASSESADVKKTEILTKEGE